MLFPKIHDVVSKGTCKGRREMLSDIVLRSDVISSEILRSNEHKKQTEMGFHFEVG